MPLYSLIGITSVLRNILILLFVEFLCVFEFSKLFRHSCQNLYIMGFDHVSDTNINWVAWKNWFIFWTWLKVMGQAFTNRKRGLYCSLWLLLLGSTSLSLLTDSENPHPALHLQLPHGALTPLGWSRWCALQGIVDEHFVRSSRCSHRMDRDTGKWEGMKITT